MKLGLVFVFDLSFGVLTLLGEKIPQQVEDSVEEGSAMKNDKATINCCRFGSQNSVKREAGSGWSNCQYCQFLDSSVSYDSQIVK